MTDVSLSLDAFVRSGALIVPDSFASGGNARRRLRDALRAAIAPVPLEIYRWQQNERIFDEIVRVYATIDDDTLATLHTDRREPSRWDPVHKIWEPLGVGVACTVTDTAKPNYVDAPYYVGVQLQGMFAPSRTLFQLADTDDDVEALRSQSHNGFWRDLDNIYGGGELLPHLALFNDIVHVWIHDAPDLPVWRHAIQQADVVASVRALSAAIAAVMRKHYGATPSRDAFLDGCQAMGSETIWDGRNNRRMDDYRQWFSMCAFADAWGSLGDPLAGLFHRGALCGLLHGALVRRRFKLGAWQQVRQPGQILDYVVYLPDPVTAQTKDITNSSHLAMV